VEAGAFFAELKRRRVIRALVGYGIASFAVLQIVEPLMHGFHWPDAILSYVVVALAAGFPIVVALAWIFDVESAGIKRTVPVRPMRARTAIVLTAIGVAAAVPGLVWYLAIRRPPPSSPNASIAVLPFVNLSPDKEQEYFSDGISEEIINALAHVEGLRVAGRTSSFSFKGKNEDLRAIGEKLNVATVLDGSVRREGTRVRISAQLVNAADGYHLWSEQFDRDLTGIFLLQDEISRSVVEALKVRLLGGKAVDVSDHRTANLDVYLDYMSGMQSFNRNSEDGFRRAVDAYERAIARDPSYAPAWAALASAVFALGDAFGDSPAAVSEAHRRATEAAQRAVTLGPDLAEAWDSRALVRWQVAFDWAGAQADLKRALSLKPGDPVIRKDYADVLATLGRLREAIAEAQKAAAIDPLSGRLWNALGRYYNATGQTDLARSALNRALEITPDSFSSPYHLATSYLLDRQPRAALGAIAGYRNEGNRLIATAMAEHDLGHPQESKRVMDTAVSKYGHVLAFQIAEGYAWLGMHDAAFAWLARAHAQHDGGITLVKFSPLLRSLRDDPRYAALLRTLNLQQD
jgi:TolB-like protein/Tfp pilus assembly protein PilF